MMTNQKNIIIKKYLEQHSLVESNILSFHDFKENKMQHIVDELKENIDNEEIEIKLGKLRIEKPNIIEADGSSSVILPSVARLRNLTYSAPVYVELTVRYEGQTDSAEVEVGRIPIMVRSSACTTAGMPREKLIENFMDKLDPGGYFIINGN